MPKNQQKNLTFQLEGYWLSRRANNASWHRTWLDEGTGQTRYSSLGTTDFDRAKKRLTDWYIVNRKPVQEEPENALLCDILARYWAGHARYIASCDRTGIALGYWVDFWQERTLADVRPIVEQEAFHQWLLAKGMKVTTVSRVLGVGRAAINRAWKRGEIKNPPFIQEIATAQDKQAAPPKGRTMEPAEVTRLFEASTHAPLQAFVVLLVATAARPSAILELTLAQCDVKNRLIDLNPRGRVQNKKYRPTLRMPESVVPLLQNLHNCHSPDMHVVGESGSPILDVKRPWDAARKRAWLDEEVRPYSLRHTMARWLRKQGVPAWEVSAQLGHKQKGLGITEIYAPHDPSYLSKSTKAIDSFFGLLRSNCLPLDSFLSLPNR